MPVTKILVAEDENIVAKDIQNRLESLGYQVTGVVATGRDAVKAATSHQPDLVLMDIMLKGNQDGIQTAEQIQELHNIPVVYLTAYADQVTLERAKVTKPYGYILKPFEERELHITVEMALYKHQMEEKLRKSQQWLATTLNCIGDAVIATDLNGRIQFINPIAELLTGWREKDALGKNLSEVFIIRDEKTGRRTGHTVSDFLRQMAAAGQSQPLQLISRTNRGIPIDNRAAPIKDEPGKLIGLVLTFHDITERKQAEEHIQRINEDLIRANEELKTLDRLKNNLLSNVSHELRTPLVAVRGYNEMIAGGYSGPVSDKQKYQLNISLRSIDRLVLLIDSLLDFSKLELGRERLRLEKFDIREIAQEAVSLVLPKAQARDITLRQELPDQKTYLYADRNKIFQVFINLLENAVKFNNPAGSVSLVIQTTPDQTVKVSVTDDGIGIAPDKLNNIFDRFYQIDSSSTRRFSGMGIGLSLCRDIITFHQGKLSVISQEGQGSTFTFFLPLYRQAVKQHAARPTEPVLRGQPGALKVLIFDKDPDVIRYLETMFTSPEFRPLLARTTDEVIHMLDYEKADVILVGFSGKRSGGWTLCQKIRSHSHGKHLPLFIMAPRGLVTKAQARRAGAQDTLTKPVRQQTLVRKLQQAAHIRRDQTRRP